jgi:hypothetical protein
MDHSDQLHNLQVAFFQVKSKLENNLECKNQVQILYN